MFTVRQTPIQPGAPTPKRRALDPSQALAAAGSRIPGGLSRAKSDYRAMPVFHQRSFVTWEREPSFLENIWNLPPCQSS